MDWHTLFIILHIIGVAMGAGGAIITDSLFLRSIKNKVISADELAIFQTISHVIWSGFWLLVASGLAMFWLIYNQSGQLSLLSSSRWQMKLTLVAIVFINGLIFKKKVFPLLEQIKGQGLNIEILGQRLWLLAITGSISAVSWFSIVILSLLPRTFRPDYLLLLAGWGVLVGIGIGVAKTLLKEKLT